MPRLIRVMSQTVEHRVCRGEDGQGVTMRDILGPDQEDIISSLSCERHTGPQSRKRFSFKLYNYSF